MDRQYKRPESVLVLVLAAGKVLQLRRVDPPDFWQSVTGSLEEGEAPLAAAHRELLEETAIDAWPEPTGRVNVYPIRPEWRHRYAPDVTENREHVYLLELDDIPQVRTDLGEHQEFRWLSPGAAAKLASSRTDAAAIRELAAT